MVKSLFKFRKDKDANQVTKSHKPYDGPVDLLIENACIVTCDDAFTIYEYGSVAVAGGKIVAIVGDADSKNSKLDQRATEKIDASGSILMPGLINTHCHAGDSLFRGLVEGLPLEPWLEKLWVAETAVLTPETIKLGSQLGYVENLLNGVTTVMDMFWEPVCLLEAAETVGVRVATGGIFFDPPGIDGATADQREGLARKFFDVYKDHPSLIPSVSVHGAYTVGPDNLKIAKAIQDEYNSLITIHAAETKAEQATIQEQYGRSVIMHLEQLGFLSNKAVLAHCVHLDDKEIEVLARAGATVSHNPASNLKLGSGIARVPDMLAQGVSIALGTDGAVSGNDLNMWNAIRLAATLHNGANENALAISAKEAILMATINGAQALGIADEAGSLELGKRADLILINPHQIHGIPIFDPVNYLAFAASNHDVEHVWSGGRKVVENRRVLKVDTGALIEEVNKLVPSISASLSVSS